jgi:hypothetical protein
MKLHAWVKILNFDLLPIGIPGTSHDRPVLQQARRQPQVNFHMLFKPEYSRLSKYTSGSKSLR